MSERSVYLKSTKSLVKCKCPCCGKIYDKRMFYTGKKVKYVLKACKNAPGCGESNNAGLDDAPQENTIYM